MADDTSQQPALAKNLISNKSFHLLWTSTLASGFGDRMAAFAALALLGYAGEGTDNASISSGIDFFFFLPYLLWSPIAGWMADRFPRRWLMFVADESRGVFILLMLFLLSGLAEGSSGISPDQHWILWTLIFFIGVMAATFGPAKLSIVPNVVGNQLLTRANATVTSMGIIGNISGFMLIGALKLDVTLMITLAAVSYIVSGFFWLFVKTPYAHVAKEQQSTTPIKALIDIKEGVKYAVKHKVVLSLIATAAVLWTATAIYKPAISFIAQSPDMYAGDEQTLGIAMAPLGIGMLLSAVMMGIFNPRLGGEVLLSFGLVLGGLFMGAQMFISNMTLGLVMGFGLGLSGGVILVTLNTLVQRATPDRMRGRVFAAKEMILEIGNVGIAYTIWRTSQADAIILNASIAYSVFFIFTGFVGIYYFVLRGPLPTKSMNFFWRLIRLHTHVWHQLKITGRHNIPRTEGLLIVSNHTAGLDPLIVQSAVHRRVRFMMAKEYMIWPLKWFWNIIKPIPVDRKKNDSSALRTTVQAVKTGDVVGIFPEGKINRERKDLLPLKPGMTLIAERTKATILPVFISGTPNTYLATPSIIIPSKSSINIGKPFKLDPAGDRAAHMQQIHDAIVALQPPDDKS